MNKGIYESYDYFVKILKVVEKLGGSCQIKNANSETEISEYEQKIGFTLSEEYKDWLRLTKGIEISWGIVYLRIYMANKAYDHEDGFKALMIGDGLFNHYYINLETGKPYVYDDDFGTAEFDSFEEMLDEMYYSEIEDSLNRKEDAENWVSIYDEMFPEDK
jgi:hypothetical protein